jgi:hypothetical protein
MKKDMESDDHSRSQAPISQEKGNPDRKGSIDQDPGPAGKPVKVLVDPVSLQVVPLSQVIGHPHDQ